MQDEVRAPILPRSEVLVEDDPMERFRRRKASPGFDSNAPRNAFEMFRDFRQESRTNSMK